MSTRNRVNRVHSSKILHSFNHHEKLLSIDFRLKPYFYENKLGTKFSLKSSLESLLYQIKTSQMDYISNKSIKTNNLQNTKEILVLLKNSLTLMLKEKNKLYKYNKEKFDKKKRDIQKIIYPNYEDTEKNETLGNKKLYSSETNQLKILNFQIENEISNTDFLIERYNQKIYEIKSNPFFTSDENEIYGNNYKNLLIVLNILHEKINKSRRNLIDIVNKKTEQDMEINTLSIKKEYLQGIIKTNKDNEYINGENYIIPEELNEYSNIIDNSSSNSNEIAKQNKLKYESNDSINKKFYRINQENFIRKRLIFSKTVSPRIINIYNIKNTLIDKIKSKRVNDEVNNETILKSFNSSLDSDYLVNQKKELFRKSISNFHNQNVICAPGSNGNSNTDNSNNKSSSNESNSEYLSNDINKKIKENEEENYIFSVSEKD